MDFFELTKKRCSYRRNYTEKKISDEDIKLIMSAALNAPTGCNMQTTEFVVISDNEIIKEISNICTGESIKTAQALILCVIDQNPPEVVRGLSFQIEDCAAAVMSMLLAITELGYSSVWIDGQLKSDNKAEKIGKLIDLPADKKIQILLPVGEAAVEVSQPIKDPFEKRICYNKYTL